ncbi:uncharacterized protein LOC118491554 [Helianthus annuus]|uniref:uncharacterized protein LOC118491554 n=1 Tax=Helianthus annuus TaxID=4232 RepID=UPI001652F65F|nr:uncharacterized protein LOC118491554 [Helianthus annuus]
MRWVRWEKLVKPKDYGGIGMGGIGEFNHTMLAKWWWRYKDEPSQLWVSVIQAIHKSGLGKSMIPGKGKWTWEIKENKGFSAKCFRTEIMRVNAVMDSNIRFIWNSWTPLKRNNLLWRVLMGKIATKTELVARGVVLQNIVYDRCGYNDEDPNHLFVNCLWARSTWWQVCVWMRIPIPMDMSSVKSILESIMENPGSRWKKLSIQ